MKRKLLALVIILTPVAAYAYSSSDSRIDHLNSRIQMLESRIDRLENLINEVRR